jgi:hypothetical protein
LIGSHQSRRAPYQSIVSAIPCSNVCRGSQPVRLVSFALSTA